MCSMYVWYWRSEHKFLLLVVSLRMNSRKGATSQNSKMLFLGIATRRQTMLCNATSVPQKCFRSLTHLVDADPCYIYRDSKKPKNPKGTGDTNDIMVHLRRLPLSRAVIAV